MEGNEEEENFMLEVDSLENFVIWLIHPTIFEVLVSIFFSLPLRQCLLLFCVKVYIDTEGFWPVVFNLGWFGFIKSDFRMREHLEYPYEPFLRGVFILDKTYCQRTWVNLYLYLTACLRVWV